MEIRGKIFDECYGVRSTSDGGYIMSCGTGIEPGFFEGSSYWDSWRILAIKTDSLGNFVWDFTSRDIEGEKAGEYIENTLDGAYMIFCRCWEYRIFEIIRANSRI